MAKYHTKKAKVEIQDSNGEWIDISSSMVVPPPPNRKKRNLDSLIHHADLARRFDFIFHIDHLPMCVIGNIAFFQN